MDGKKKGLKIGHWRIKPLGLATLGALVLIIAAVLVLTLVKPFDRTSDPQQRVTNLATEAPDDSATAQPTARPTATVRPEPRTATIRALGEIAIETDMMAAAIDAESNRFDFSPMFSLVDQSIGAADYTIGDVEGVMGGTMGIRSNGAEMITPPDLLTALKGAGVDMLTLANDHAMDGTVDELLATIANADGAGLDHVGAYTSQEDRNTPVIKTIKGIKVGFLAYTDSLNGNDSKVPAEMAPWLVSGVANSNVQEDISRLRSAGAEVVIACVSWGQMFSPEVTDVQKQIAMILTRCGVDVIIGYNPHTVQPAYWLEAPAADNSGVYNRTLCLCATGNFLSNQRDSGLDCGIIFQFTIQEQDDGSFSIINPEYVPTYVLRYEDENSTPESPQYEYRTLAVGQWLDTDVANLPEGMTYSDQQYIAKVWDYIQSVMGSDTCTLSRQ